MILACEDTSDGWRALTTKGDVLEIRSTIGMPPAGETVTLPDGQYRLPEKTPGIIGQYLDHAYRSLALFKVNAFARALDEVDNAIRIAPTERARYNRALIRLSLGHWPDAFEDFDLRLGLREHDQCPPLGPRWNGEPLAGKTLALVHDHGFGDTIMMLRYAPVLREMGARVLLVVPPELRRLAGQIAALDGDADMYCPIMSLLHLLRQTPDNIPAPGRYLTPDRHLVAHWEAGLGPKRRRRVGIAWSVGRIAEGDYERSAPLDMFVDAFPDADLFSIQAQGREDARAQGVTAFEFEDFADCAALISLMDEIVTIDTAALHVAGAIGHPHVTAILPCWSSWRWLAPWYPSVTFHQQDAPGEWAGVFAKLSPPNAAAGTGGGAYRAGPPSESLAGRV